MNHGHLVFLALRCNLQCNFRNALELGDWISGKIKFGQLTKLIWCFIIVLASSCHRSSLVLWNCSVWEENKKHKSTEIRELLSWWKHGGAGRVACSARAWECHTTFPIPCPNFHSCTWNSPIKSEPENHRHPISDPNKARAPSSLSLSFSTLDLTVWASSGVLSTLQELCVINLVLQSFLIFVAMVLLTNIITTGLTTTVLTPVRKSLWGFHTSTTSHVDASDSPMTASLG